MFLPFLCSYSDVCVDTGAAPIQPYGISTDQMAGFRYRVEDVLRAVTKNAIKDARLQELKQEIVNSEKLKVCCTTF